MDRLDDIFDDATEPASYARKYLDFLSRVLGRIDTGSIARFVELLLDARERGAAIFFIGNGGSAATASHFANDIAVGTRPKDKPFRALSLTDNVAVLTAIGNDHGYDEIFVRQLRAHMRPGDVVVAISASGNSANVVKAIEYANANEGVTVALTGFDGGRLREAARYDVHVPTHKGEYGPVEDAHMVLDHLVASYLIRHLQAAGERE
jgi:D-sedoheptulose 7-phosphate isomerase